MKTFFASIIDTISPLLHSLRGEKGDKLRALLDSSEGLPNEAFAEVLSLEDARTLGFLMGFDDEAELSMELPEISLKDGLALRKLVDDKLRGLMDHPAVDLLIERAVNPDVEEKGGSADDTEMEDDSSHDANVKRIMRIGVNPMLQGMDEDVAPFFRLFLFDINDSVLLDTTAHPGDVGFLARSFSGLLLQMCMYSEPWVSKGLITMPYREAIARSIESLESDLAKLKEVAPRLGILPKTAKGEETLSLERKTETE